MTISEEEPFEFRAALLKSDTVPRWDSVIRAVRPPALLLLIEARMGGELARQVDPDSIWQQTLHQAWQERRTFRGKNLSDFRRWIIKLAEKHVRAVVRRSQGKTGEKETPIMSLPLSAAFRHEHSGAEYAGPVPRSNALRADLDRDEASAMRRCLDALTPEVRYVLWLSEFEGLSTTDIQDRLELTPETVRDRLRRGLISFHHKIRTARRQRAGEHPG